MTPTAIVATGGGLHFYWVFDKPIDATRWRSLATALRDTMGSALKIDPQVTVNPVSLLRVPGSYNTKYTPPRLVRLKWNGKTYTEQEISGLLGVKTANVIPFRGRSANSDLIDGISAPPPPPARFIAQTCPTIKDSLRRRGAGDRYPLWKNILHVLAFCGGGLEVARECSEGHESFTEAEFQKQWRSSRQIAEDGGQPGPTTCATFAALSEHCRTCPFRSDDIVSPISLGKFSREVGQVGGTGQPSSDPAASVPGHSRKDDSMPLFFADGHTYARLTLPSNEGGMAVHTIRFSKSRLVEFSLSDNYGEKPKMKFVVENDTNGKTARKNAEIELGDIADKKALMRKMHELMIVCDPVGKKYMADVFEQTLHALIRRRAVEARPNDFGWNDDRSFSLGHIRFVPGSLPVRNQPVNFSVANYYKPTGSFAKWLKAANAVLGADTQPALHMVVAMSIGSMLMKFSPDRGVTLAIFSSRSGTGKTTAIRLAASIWADPTHSVFSMNDTGNGVQSRLGLINDLPMFWDEVRMNRANHYVRETVFRVGQGRTKARSTVRGEEIEGRVIRSPLIIASNYNLLRSVAADDSGDTAGFYRVMQVEMLARQVNSAEAFDLMRAVENNYGAAGAYVANYVVNNLKQVQDWFSSEMQVVAMEQSLRPEERFWRLGAAMMLTGVRIAEAIGLVKLSRASVMRGIGAAFQAGRDRVGSVSESGKLVSYDIAVWAQQHLVRVDMAAGKISQGSLSGINKVFYDIKTYDLYVPFQTIAEFSRAIGREEAMVHELISRLPGVVAKRGVIGRGTPFETMPMDYYICDGKRVEQALPT